MEKSTNVCYNSIGGWLMYEEEYYVIKNKLTELETNLDNINNTPGCVADRERTKLQYQELLTEKHDLEYRVTEQKRILESYIRHFSKKSLLDDYVFEVYWKNLLSSRVSVRKNTVRIKRIIVHPLRQIFPSNEITRNRLNEILELRCFDKNRPDASRILESLGLSSYRPIDIIKKTHGVSYNDYIWFRFMGENICAEDVLVRE